jgi:hypothetical protein
LNVNQKGTALLDGALTDEVMESSHSILTQSLYGGQKGLQQFYSPEQLAKLAAKVIGTGVAVLDPTAGDGMLLSEFPATNRFGIEIDHDQVKNAKESNRGYFEIKGDIQHVYNLLRQSMPSWDAIVANPPFGLQWEEPTYRGGKATNSTVLTFVYLNRLLSEDGQYVFVCGAKRFYDRIAKLEEASGVYAVVECEDLFDNVTIPCVVAFGIHPSLRSHDGKQGFEKRKLTRDMLDLAGDWVTEQRDEALGRYNRVSSHTYGTYAYDTKFKVIQDEYNRRLEGRVKLNREYDALLVGGKAIQWLPSAYAKLALSQTNDERAFQGLNGQPINYFGQNERLWSKMLAYEERGLLTIEPKLFHAVEQITGLIRKERQPLYHVKPTQRLGFLTDVESLTCIKSDPEMNFSKGESYRLDTQTKTIIEREKRMVESKKTPGEWSEREFEKQKKALEIRVGHHAFLDGGKDASRNIKWLLNHFDIPDPGDVGTKHPEEIQALEDLVREVMTTFQERSAVWEKKNPTAMPFTVREFQIKDTARLLFKGGGLNSWEQGLGKTVGGLAFAEAAKRLGAKDQLLIVTANDLLDQWKRESQRFLGRTPEIIRTHGQAHDIAKRMRQGEPGFFITHYGVLSINGTKGKNKLLPPITVREWQEPRKVKGTGRYGYYFWATTEDEETPLVFDAIKEAATAAVREEQDEEYVSHNQMLRKVREMGYIQIPIPDNEAHAWQAKNDPDKCLVGHGRIPERSYQITKRLTSKDLCPECEADHRNGWNGAYCESKKKDGSICGYSHYAIKMRPIASKLSTAFRNGIGIYDEVQMMQARAGVIGSKRSIAMRGPKFKYFLGMTGTPIKNYIDQAFWPLWRCLGNASVRFPFDYNSGDIKFESDFAVVEYSRDDGRRGNRKALPEVTNLSMLWRLLSSSIIRRRKEETGEPLVPKYYHEIRVPMGMAQAEQYSVWLKDFPSFFAEKFPDHPIVKAGFHVIRAATLGMNWKLDRACVLPEGDPDAEWTGVDGLSNFTPANLRVLELCMALAKDGRKVLVGSHLKEYGKWVAERLVEKGVKAVHILDENDNTVDADDRADRVYQFQTDEDTQVFCAGTKAIRLGHNLDAADAVILNGLDFDYETLDQFIARIHRLTSKNPVDVFVILPSLSGQDTITTRKWTLLDMKGGAAELALDGRLIDKHEQVITMDMLVTELRERGFNVTDEAVDEVSVQEDWEAAPQLEDYEPSEHVIPPRVIIDGPPPLTLTGIQIAVTIGKLFRKIAEPAEGEQLDLTQAAVTVPDEAVLEQNEAEFDAQLDQLDAELDEFEANSTIFLDSFLAALYPTREEFEQNSATKAETEPESTDSVDEAAPTIEGALPVDSRDEAAQDEQPEVRTAPDTSGGQVANEPTATAGTAHVTEEAASGGLVPAAFDPMGQLKQAKELHELGILDDNEYAAAKASLLAQIGVGR